MSGGRSFKRGPAAYRRGKPKFPPSGKTFLIVTEGSNTEPNYLRVLRDRLQLNAAEVIVVHPNGTDPITLTKKAIELRDERKNQAKKGSVIAFDEVWVVFDLEQTHSQRRALAVQAMAMKGAKGIQSAVSDPCFEYWLLLHFEYSTSPCPDCASVTKLLKSHYPNYDKGQVHHALIESLPVAVRNAQNIRKHHERAGGDGNPATCVDLLAMSLNAATRVHLQFQLA